MDPHQVSPHPHHSGFEHQRLALSPFGLPTDRIVWFRKIVSGSEL